jgi:hypothetical protein
MIVPYALFVSAIRTKGLTNVEFSSRVGYYPHSFAYTGPNELQEQSQKPVKISRGLHLLVS